MRVISVDLLGYGSSDKSKDAGDLYATPKQAERVRALLKQLNVKRYGLLMHDMGGLVAWEMVRQDPVAINELFGLNTSINQEGFNHPSLKEGMYTRQLVSAYSNDLTSTLVPEQSFNDLGLTSDFKLTEAER